MLVISYGIPKSGSTLAFELIRGILTSAGHNQEAFRNDRLDASDRKGRGIKRNFVSGIDREAIEEMLARVRADQVIAVKTHSPFAVPLFPWLEELQQKRAIQVIASYRDPRDICLSLMDAGARSREKGKTAFAAVGGLEKAAVNVQRRINSFRKWAALRGTLRLNYDDVAFETDKAIDAVEGTLGVKSDRAEVMRYAFEEAHTLKNKAKRNRHEDELDEEQKEFLRKTFRPFIRKVMEQNDQRWFDKFREEMLARDASDDDDADEE